MDILAALALMMAIEGLAAIMLASRLPEIARMLGDMDPETVRIAGLVLVAAGGGLYLFVRS